MSIDWNWTRKLPAERMPSSWSPLWWIEEHELVPSFLLASYCQHTLEYILILIFRKKNLYQSFSCTYLLQGCVCWSHISLKSQRLYMEGVLQAVLAVVKIYEGCVYFDRMMHLLKFVRCRAFSWFLTRTQHTLIIPSDILRLFDLIFRDMGCYVEWRSGWLCAQ